MTTATPITIPRLTKRQILTPRGVLLAPWLGEYIRVYNRALTREPFLEDQREILGAIY